ncbi:hypothetical protein [Methylobacterium iners]|uniref:hypothetical protein n=1 Tax=Methylobacterium iners TaxID=418707 RepID=UPI001EE2DD14|nr:hypothetical protein [Methylobacterium iners]
MATLEALRSGRSGYADGGFVGSTPGRDRFTMPSRQAGSSGTSENTTGKTELHVYAGETNEVKTTQGPQGVRHEIMIDKAVARALLEGSSTRGVLKQIGAGRLTGK